MTNTSAAPDDEEDAPIEISSYDSSWPGKFACERELLGKLLAPWIVGPIEHIGSTAVPGLDSKPVIDIMVAVESLEASKEAIPAAARAQYKYWPYKADSMHWLCKPSASLRTHHLHLVPFGGWLWRARLAFRDALRRDRKLAREYAELKYSLARKYRHDRDGYTESKSQFVQAVLASPGVEISSRRPDRDIGSLVPRSRPPLDGIEPMGPLPRIEHLIPELRRMGIEVPHAAKVGAFGDSAEQSRELLALIRSGLKRGGAALLWAYQAEGESIPEAGDIEVVVDHLAKPSLVTRITQVEIMPFNMVSRSFAAREGEGDGSLEYWRREHWSFFSRECQRIDREPHESMPVVCCSFEVLHVMPDTEAG